MNKILSAVIASYFYIFSSALLAEDSEKLYQQHCSACHGSTDQGQRRIAPPIFAVKNHYLAVHDEELTFVDAINSWVAKPAED